MSDEFNWQQLAEGFRLERDIMQEMAMKAREAGRREGLEEAAKAMCALCEYSSPEKCMAAIDGTTKLYHMGRHEGRCRAATIRALIDSPKAEGEETK